MPQGRKRRRHWGAKQGALNRGLLLGENKHAHPPETESDKKLEWRKHGEVYIKMPF